MELYPLKIYLIVTTWFSKKSENKIFHHTFYVPPGTTKLYHGNMNIDLKGEARWDVKNHCFVGTAYADFSGYHMVDVEPDLRSVGWKTEGL